MCDLHNNLGQCFKGHVFRHKLITSFRTSTSAAEQFPFSHQDRRDPALHPKIPPPIQKCRCKTSFSAVHRWRSEKSMNVCICVCVGLWVSKTKASQESPNMLLTFKFCPEAVWISFQPGIWWKCVVFSDRKHDRCFHTSLFVSSERSGVRSHSGRLEREDRQIESRAGRL